MLEFTVSTILPATKEELFDAWLDSEKHTAMTGGVAKVNATLGASFEAWDGYITGKNLELIPSERIVQSWRTSEFSETEDDSQIEITLKSVEGGTKLTLFHSHLPPHGEQYETGWEEAYFEPMRNYFKKV